ncbi:MAG: mercuric reductase [Acidobacteriota bacterium]|nr:mercuric reductase [Acidobacteriota bacterium]
MTPIEKYRAIVIGSGQGGTPLSMAMAAAGWKTALIERAHVGGTCINEGCTPTKTMVASARAADMARRAGDYGVKTGRVEVDMEAVRKRKRDIVASFHEGSRQRIKKTEGLDLIMGQARFTAPGRVAIRLNDGGTRTLSADTIIIDTGTRLRIPSLPGLDGVGALDSTSIMELDTVPEHLLVIGGGYIGVEFGQMFRRFGSRVTLVQRGKQLLPREDEDIARKILEILQEDGVNVLTETEPLGVSRGSRGRIELTLRAPSGESRLIGSHLLAAAGRVPNTDMLDPETAGIELDRRGYIKVNERLETSAEGVFAAGDVKGGPAFTHISYDDFRILRTNLLQEGKADTNGRFVPYTVFMDPQLGRIGLTEKEVRENGRRYLVAEMPMAHVARAIETGETRGAMKVIVDPETEQILGAAILGMDGGEVMAALQMAMMGGVPYPSIRDGIFAHPTLAESFNNLFAAPQTRQR